MKKIVILIIVFSCYISTIAQTDSLAYFLKKGNSKYMINDYFGALQDFSEAIRINPSNYEAYKMRGIVHYSNYNYRSALKDMEKSANLNKGCTECMFYLSKIHENIGDTAKSKKYLSELKESMLYSSASTHIRNGNYILNKFKNYKEAEGHYIKAIDIYPLAEAFYKIGYIRLQEKKFSESIVQFDKAIALDSTYYLAYAYKGSALLSLNNYQEAVTYCSKSIAYSPEYADAYAYRGNAYYYLSILDKASADWKKAKELGAKDVVELLSTSYNK